MKKVIAVILAVMAAGAQAGGFGTLGLAQVDSDVVDSDIMLAAEVGWQNEWLRAGVHLMASADTTYTTTVLVTPGTPPATPRNPNPVPRDPYYADISHEYSTYGACVGVHKVIGQVDPYAGVCFGRHDYGIREEDAASARVGIGAALLGMRVGLDYFYDDTDEEQQRFMLSGTYPF